MECLYQVPIPNQEDFDNICAAISTFTYLKCFNFMAILAAIYSSPDNASINFVLTQKINLSTILELFDHCSIQYFQTYNTLIFQASPTKLEEALLTALDIGVSVPPSFLTSSKRIVFTNTEHCLQARILKFSDIGVVELQITRCDLCTTSDIFFTPSFLEFAKQRFHCVSQPQLCMVKNHLGEVREVLAITSSSLLFKHISQDSLPLSFVHASHNFSLAYLEPLLHMKPKPTVDYPYETQIEHFQRFQNPSDSLASRIPVLNPHEAKGGDLARNIIMSLSPGFLTHPEFNISFLQSPPHIFFISCLPLSMMNGEHVWLISSVILISISSTSLCRISPSTHRSSSFSICPLALPLLFPTFNNPLRLANQGWISVLPFSTCKILTVLPFLHMNTFLCSSRHWPLNCNPPLIPLLLVSPPYCQLFLTLAHPLSQAMIPIWSLMKSFPLKIHLVSLSLPSSSFVTGFYPTMHGLKTLIIPDKGYLTA